ncbi:MAG TPA: glycoside hydrolase family 6 protein [Polyangiaceae bacterium]|nr:glycoside hydrolase family 6 protein [Polyangiaceae bacterium]
MRFVEMAGFCVTLGLSATIAVGCSVGARDEENVAGQALELKRHNPCPEEARLFVPDPNPAATEQIRSLRRAHDRKNAALVEAMVDTPQSVWLVGGTPDDVADRVKTTMKKARSQRAIPVFIAYNIPFRDCSGLSAGGAQNTAEYLAWIDAIARAIGRADAMVILEPDSLGIIPYHVALGGSEEWCRPADADATTASAERYAQLNSAVDRLKQQPNVRVYLDGTHSHWLGSGDAAWRLSRAGIERADGFFLNTSNYQASERLEKYGTWVSSCLAFANNPDEGGWRVGRYDWCGSQYYPANVDDFSTWGATDDWYAANLGSAIPSTHFVIDTSRNGQGPWVPPSDAPAGDPQDWCNPPGRGLGYRPALCSTEDGASTTSCSRTPLLEANLWLKIPGESDGQCTRWAPGGTTDPARGMEDPQAGAWFPEQVLELVQLASPPLARH